MAHENTKLYLLKTEKNKHQSLYHQKTLLMINYLLLFS